MEAREGIARRPLGLRTVLGRLFAGGTVGNRRLTATTAAVLLVLLAAEGGTLLALRPLLSVHVSLGMLLIPPIALKLGSTGYRFARYYARAAAYRLEGPPGLLMRLLVAPLVVASTLGLFVSGVALIVVGPGGGMMLALHKASFLIWFFAMSAHVLAYVLRLPQLVRADFAKAPRSSGVALRRFFVAAALVAGVTLAVATLPLARPWLHWIRVDHGHRDGIGSPPPAASYATAVSARRSSRSARL